VTRRASVSMVINTTGLEYDDRLRKEVGSLKARGIDVAIVAIEYANTEGRRLVYDGVPATTFRLRSRTWFPRSRGVIVKTLELYFRIIARLLLTRPSVVWCHDLEMGALVPVLALMRACGAVDRVVWDQHELPADRLLASRAYRQLFAWLVNGCDRIVVASAERREYMARWLDGRVRTPVDALENYPDATFASLPVRDLPDDLDAWLDGRPYLVAQGGANPDRHLPNLVAAVMRTGLFKLVVVGPFSAPQVEALERAHGAALRDRVFFTGLKPQLDLARFLDHAVASVVLYQASSANTRLCAANRLYQAIVRRVPVIAGSNPPMARVVSALGCGVVLHSDGADVDDVCDGIRRLADGLSDIRPAMAGAFTWESQATRVAEIAEASAATDSYENALSVAGCERR